MVEWVIFGERVVRAAAECTARQSAPRPMIVVTTRIAGPRNGISSAYDLPGLQTVDGIAVVEGNYPSKGGIGERGAWFRDSEGNLFGIGQPLVQAEAVKTRAETEPEASAERLEL